MIIITRSKIIQKIPARHREKARTQGTRENSHIGNCVHTSESSNVKYTTFIMENSITRKKIVTTECLQNYIPQKHGLFQICDCKYLAYRR
jgi:hypothetical protein